MRTQGVIAALAILTVLTACAPAAEPSNRTSSAASPSVAATSPAPAVETRTFAMPTLCGSALPASRLAALTARHLVLLGGPEGRYGNDYAAEPTPEELAGGITCIWGPSDTEASVITVSVAPLSAATFADTVDSLLDQGLNETIDDGYSAYWQQGDEQSVPAIVNVLRPSSWISVIESVGGEDAYEEAVAIANEAFESAYSAG